jgi:hypothetical protein
MALLIRGSSATLRARGGGDYVPETGKNDSLARSASAPASDFPQMARPMNVYPQGFLSHLYAMQEHKGVVRDANLEVRKLMPKRFRHHGSNLSLVAGGLHAAHRTKTAIESPAAFKMRRDRKDDAFDPLTVCAPLVYEQLEAEVRRGLLVVADEIGRKEKVRRVRLARDRIRLQRSAEMVEKNLQARLQVRRGAKHEVLLAANKLLDPKVTANSVDTPRQSLLRSASYREIRPEALPPYEGDIEETASVHTSQFRPHALRPYHPPPSFTSPDSESKLHLFTRIPSTSIQLSTRSHSASAKPRSVHAPHANEERSRSRPSTSKVVPTKLSLPSDPYIFSPMHTPNHISNKFSLHSPDSPPPSSYSSNAARLNFTRDPG